MSDRADLEEVLRQAGANGDEKLDIGHVALALAGLDRPQVPLDRYHSHLMQLTTELTALSAEANAARAAGHLQQVMARDHGYRGDELTYDDQQNANLMRVIDRRKGLPVALGILYIHAGRTAGWNMAGLSFPAHFLIRVEIDGSREILDPFGEGRIMRPQDLRDLLKRVGGDEAEMDSAYYRAVPDRDILLRLQNNIKTRAIQARDATRAGDIVRRMLLLAPERGFLYRELGLLEAHAGNMGAAIAAMESYLERTDSAAERHDAAALLQQFKSKLN